MSYRRASIFRYFVRDNMRVVSCGWLSEVRMGKKTKWKMPARMPQKFQIKFYQINVMKEQELSILAPGSPHTELNSTFSHASFIKIFNINIMRNSHLKTFCHIKKTSNAILEAFPCAETPQTFRFLLFFSFLKRAFAKTGKSKTTNITTYRKSVLKRKTRRNLINP